MPDLEADSSAADRKAYAAENHGADRGLAAEKGATHDAAVRLHEIARFGVSPVQNADAAANVWSDGVVMAEWEKANGCRDRRDAQLQVRFNLAAVRPGVIPVDRRYRPRIDPDSQAGIHEIVQSHEILAGNGPAVEISHVIDQKRRVPEEHVVGPAVRLDRNKSTDEKID